MIKQSKVNDVSSEQLLDQIAEMGKFLWMIPLILMLIKHGCLDDLSLA